MNYTQGLTNDQIQRYVPSAFATQPYIGQSSRYAFIPSSAVINAMRGVGMVPVKATESRTRVEGKRGFTKHMIRFRAESQLAQQAIVGDSVMETVLVNSHDGSSTYQLMGGIFRYVCSNGMVVADSLLGSIKVRHTGNVIDEVIEGSSRIMEQAPKIMNTIKEWSSVNLSGAEQKLLAESAHSLRFTEHAKVVTGKCEVCGHYGSDCTGQSTNVTPELLLAARRRDDQGNSLWHTFNRIQENALKGVKGWTSRGRATSRAVKGIDGDVRLNKALWSLAEGMAKLKGLATI